MRIGLLDWSDRIQDLVLTIDIYQLLHSSAWPLTLLLAWFLGERLFALWRVPRVTSYFALGLLVGWADWFGMGAATFGLSFLANLALAIVLFELGYRINLRWFRHNPWVLVLGLFESALTFGAAFWASGWFGLSLEVRLILAALAVSVSPAVLVRVAADTRSSGPVTERVMHLCAINCLVAVFLVKLVLGMWHLRASGDWTAAAFGSIYALGLSAALGAAAGVAIPWLLRHFAMHSQSVTVVFSLTVLLLTTLAYGLMLSPILVALVFGIAARECRVQLSTAQRGFGSIGELLMVFLFVYVGTLIHWPDVWTSLTIAAVLLGLRLLTKTLGNLLLAHWSGISWRKGLLCGLALTPMSPFIVLLLEQTRLYGFEPASAAFAAMAALTVLQGLFGPWVAQWSLVAARETDFTHPARAHDAIVRKDNHAA